MSVRALRNIARTVYCDSGHYGMPKRLFTSEKPLENPEQSKLNLSKSCLDRLEEIYKHENNKFLRIIVDGGGCSGFQYKFELENKINDDDIVFGSDNGKVVIDKVSLDYCAGATIDYQIELIRSGFRVVSNPKAEQGCSCGASFSLKF